MFQLSEIFFIYSDFSGFSLVIIYQLKQNLYHFLNIYKALKVIVKRKFTSVSKFSLSILMI